MAKKVSKTKSRFFAQYKGPLTTKQLTEGSNLAIRNAMRLLDDAKALLAQGRYPSAAYLAIIAVEEYGKLPILDNMASADIEELEKRWKEYRSHIAKNARWILPAVADSGPKSIEQFAAVLNPNSWHQQFLDEMKQLSLYTDCLREGDWSDPKEFVKRETAKWFVEMAGRLILDKPINEEDMALRASYTQKLQSAGSQDEKKRILGEYLREASKRGYQSFTESGIQDLLYGTLDLSEEDRKA